MSVYIESGKFTTMWRKKKASTAFAANSLLTLVAGFLEPAGADAGAADKPVLGVYEGPAISSASATTDLIPVQVPVGISSLIRADTTASIAATDEGKSLDMSTSLLVHASNTTYGAVTLVRFVSATQGIFAISKNISGTVA